MPIVTSLSGHLTTIVSTPPPVSTVLSTEPFSTMLSTVVSTLPASSVLVTPTLPIKPNVSNEPVVIVTTHVYNLVTWHYLVATFLPAFVAVLLSLPLRVIDHNAKMYQPFHALSGSGHHHHNHHHNARGSESLTLAFTGLFGEPVPLLTTTLVGLSSLMAPLATEALSIRLHVSCSVTDESGCAGSLGVSVAPAYALVDLLVLMLALLAALLILLRRWRTGLRASPWNLAGIAALAACPDLINGAGVSRGEAVATEKSLKRALEDRRFALGFYETANGHEAFGIVPAHEDSAQRCRGASDNRDDEGDRGDLYLGGLGGDGDDSPLGQPFLALTVAYRAAFAVFLAALLALVLVYHIVAAGAGGASGTINMAATRFGNWVATNSFGVRFAMAALGVVVSFCWTALFQSVATTAPFQAMATPGRPQPPERSILLPLRPTNEISGLWVALRLACHSFGGGGHRHERPPLRHAVFLGLVALMTLASEFLPVLLTNVPYNVTQTLEASVVCARSVAVHWPALPADPRTIAGAMFYVVDSHVLPAALASIADTTGGACVALMDTKEKTARVRQLGRRYYYGDIVGRSGRRRFSVDADVTMLDPVVDHMPAAEAGQGTSMVTTAYRGGPFYVYNREARYQRQQQHEEDPAFI
ncbi:hypothetical protein SCUCBS95973_004278 [Sporothrix curviconia]|uniref:Integral membrane protein n=1 Tax=Sporothrix curviconia TaxID=1260050 RepID=A0ABP0BMD2_9PEZI